jgi:hypothetical protein
MGSNPETKTKENGFLTNSSQLDHKIPITLVLQPTAKPHVSSARWILSSGFTSSKGKKKLRTLNLMVTSWITSYTTDTTQSNDPIHFDITPSNALSWLSTHFPNPPNHKNS